VANDVPRASAGASTDHMVPDTLGVPQPPDFGKSTAAPPSFLTAAATPAGKSSNQAIHAGVGNAVPTAPLAQAAPPSTVSPLASGDLSSLASCPARTADFYGKSPPIANSSGELHLDEDVANGNTFHWVSSDSVLGDIDTGCTVASTYRF